MPHEYIGQAADELSRIAARSPDLSQDDVRVALLIACDTFSRLLDDSAFFAAIDATDRLAEEELYEIEWRFAESEDFCEAFLSLERRGLRDVGLSESAVRSLLDTIRGLRGVVRLDQPSEGAVREAVYRLRETTCNRADTLRDLMDTDRRRQGRWRIVKRLAIGTGSVAMIGANSGALVAVPGLTTPFAALSIAVGQGVLGGIAAEWWTG